MTNRNNPRLSSELAYLQNGWSSEVTPTSEAIAFLERYDREVAGVQ
jgi:hypothetical protein